MHQNPWVRRIGLQIQVIPCQSRTQPIIFCPHYEPIFILRQRNGHEIQQSTETGRHAEKLHPVNSLCPRSQLSLQQDEIACHGQIDRIIHQWQEVINTGNDPKKRSPYPENIP
jgi:hypothetical protein